MKTLKRSIIIREYDYPKFQRQALKNNLYDRVEFIPCDINELEQEVTLETLKNPDYLKQLDFDYMTNNFWHHNRGVRLLAKKIQKMYNTQYVKWTWEVDDDTGYIYIQAKENTSRTRIGIAWVEKDL